MTISSGEVKYCLESNFIINLLKGKQNAIEVYERIKSYPLAVTSLSSVVLFEILRGKEENQSKIEAFEKLRQQLLVLPFGEIEAVEAANIEKELHSEGYCIESMDLLIGATARINNAILVTEDNHFDHIKNLQLLKY